MKCPEIFGFVACCVGFSVAMLAGIASDSVALAVVGGVIGFAGAVTWWIAIALRPP